MYNLGKWYSKRYKKILGPGYNASLILMNSTNTDRALMSAELFLAGMFPPTVDELWADDGLKWQPIPVHTDLKELNNVSVFQLFFNILPLSLMREDGSM